MSYADFLARKHISHEPTGIADPPALSDKLKPFQADITRWALQRGRCAMFEECGLGKSWQALEWARVVVEHTDKPVLILTPLAVAGQFIREGEKLDVSVASALTGTPDREWWCPAIWVANYESIHKLEKLIPQLGGVVLDESSILKAYDGKTRTMLIEAFQQTPFRLACTATPSPNDVTELGNHAEFLDAMSRVEMLATFFCHDGGDTSKWRLKGHAERDFWAWVRTWAVCLSKPSDMGYSDDGYDLPPLRLCEHIIDVDQRMARQAGMLFAFEATTLAEQREVKKSTLAERVALAAKLVNETPGQWLVFCDLNAESEALANAIGDAIEVTGSDTVEWKEESILAFTGGMCTCNLLTKHSRQNAAFTARFNSNSSQVPGPGCTDSESIARADVRQFTGNRSDTRLSARQSNAKSICDSGTLETEIGSENIAERTGKRSTRPSVRSTNQTPSIELSTSSKRGSGKNSTLSADSTRECDTMESAQLITTECSPSSEADVQSAARRRTKRAIASSDCTSTTATLQESSEDFFAVAATMGSESSKTTLSGSSAQPCICGGQSARVIVTKGSIFGFGVNLQCASQIVFVGSDHSYEKFHQTVRRCWRFGQTQAVDVHLVRTSADGRVAHNLERKRLEHEAMVKGMVTAVDSEAGQRKRVEHVGGVSEQGRGWEMRQGDCVELVGGMADESVDFSVYSPPFASLYTYSDSDRDMGNCADHDEFFEHYTFLLRELLRVTKPGRLSSVHCMIMPTSKVRDGVIGLTDFPGRIIKAHEQAGWIYHSDVVIWKDPVTAMQRTKALGLLWKQIQKDSCMSRMGLPDRVVTFRKPGVNAEPVGHSKAEFPVDQWQRWASPVWDDINPSDTLQYQSAREEKDERHICPLQLEVIRRCVRLWSNPGDMVLSPFAGIGSEGYVALQEGRTFLGCELKPSYFVQATRNLRAAETASPGLFGPKGTVRKCAAEQVSEKESAPVD